VEVREGAANDDHSEMGGLRCHRVTQEYVSLPTLTTVWHSTPADKNQSVERKTWTRRFASALSENRQLADHTRPHTTTASQNRGFRATKPVKCQIEGLVITVGQKEAGREVVDMIEIEEVGEAVVVGVAPDENAVAVQEAHLREMDMVIEEEMVSKLLISTLSYILE
jgi:hypothetical protein